VGITRRDMLKLMGLAAAAAALGVTPRLAPPASTQNAKPMLKLERVGRYV